MKTWLLCSVSAALMLAPAQVLSLSRDQMLRYTAQNPFERFPDGRRIRRWLKNWTTTLNPTRSRS